MKREAFFAFTMLLATQAAAESESCHKVSGRYRSAEPAITVTEIRVSAGPILWNGAPVNDGEIAKYIREDVRVVPRGVFHLDWDANNERRALKLLRAIKAYGFEVAVHCDPLPF